MRGRAANVRVFVGMTVFFLSAFMLCFAQASWAKDKDKSKKTKTQQDTGSENVKWTKSPDAIPGLIKIANERKDMVKELNAETAAYGKVKDAAGKGDITAGLSIDEIKAKYGEPTVVDTWNREGLTKWIYKKPSKDIASKEKVSIIFDKDGKLTGVEEPK